MGIDRVADEGESGLLGKAKGGLAKPTQVLDQVDLDGKRVTSLWDQGDRARSLKTMRAELGS